MAPPPPSASSQTKPKKKKGPAPAHQNTTAWRHNPKSKTTARILASPIEHVCRRCRDKLVWRKQYRKYKPRTVPGKCNHCQQKTVTAAYHTICEPCSTRSPQSLQALGAYFSRLVEQSDGPPPDSRRLNEPSSPDEHTARSTSATPAEPEPTAWSSPHNNDEDTSLSPSSNVNRRRICSVCVKEPALLDTERVNSAAEQQILAVASSASSRPLRLREVKALERKLSRPERQPFNTTTVPRRVPPGVADRDGCPDDEDNEYSDDNGSDAAYDDDDAEEDEDDPFLKAIGGAEQLLVGETYRQRKLDDELAQKLVI